MVFTLRVVINRTKFDDYMPSSCERVKVHVHTYRQNCTLYIGSLPNICSISLYASIFTALVEFESKHIPSTISSKFHYKSVTTAVWVETSGPRKIFGAGKSCS